MDKKIIFLIGLHGVGKTTIAQSMRKFGFEYMSIGDMGRLIRNKKLPSGLPPKFVRLLAAHEPGRSMEDDLIKSLLDFILEKSKKTSIVIDGFPAEKHHVNLLPEGCFVVKVECKELDRASRLQIRSEQTKRKWTNGPLSIRDMNLDAVFEMASNNSKIKSTNIPNTDSAELAARKIALYAQVINPPT